jgi:hypothetical protein
MPVSPDRQRERSRHDHRPGRTSRVPPGASCRALPAGRLFEALRPVARGGHCHQRPSCPAQSCAMTGRHDRDQRTENPVMCSSYGTARDREPSRSAGRRAVITSSGRCWLRSGSPATVLRTVGWAVFLYIAAYVENLLFCRRQGLPRPPLLRPSCVPHGPTAPRVVKLIAGHGAGGGYELPDGQAPGTPRQGGRCGSVRWDAGDVSAQKRPRPVRRHAG